MRPEDRDRSDAKLEAGLQDVKDYADLQRQLREAQERVAQAERRLGLEVLAHVETQAERDAAIERGLGLYRLYQQMRTECLRAVDVAQRAIEKGEAAEALAELRGSALVLVCANIGQGTWDKMSIPARVRILEALPAEAQAQGEGQ